MHISTGTQEDHPTPLPLDDSGLPGVAPVTATAASGTQQGGVMDATSMFAEQRDQGEADVRAAQAFGMSAETGRRDHYSQDVLPQGASYGDPMNIPPVPANAVPAEDSYLYPYSGMEPTPAAAGFDDPAYGTS